jgi:hypothetical protein
MVFVCNCRMNGISLLQEEGSARGSVYLVLPSLVPLLDMSSEQNDQRRSQDQTVNQGGIGYIDAR